MRQNTKHYMLKKKLLENGEVKMQFAKTTPMLKWHGGSIRYLEVDRVKRALYKWARVSGVEIHMDYDKQSRTLSIRYVSVHH